MTKKPTCEELEKRVNELEQQVLDSRKAEDLLRQSEERFRLLYDRMPLSYQSLDEDGRLIEVNQAWIDTLGYLREEVIGKSFGDFLHPDWVDHFKENFPRFKAVGEIMGVEFEVVRKDDSIRTVSINGRIGYDENGNFTQTHCILQDKTDQKRAEDALQKAHDELEARVEERTAELAKANEQLRLEIEERRQAEKLLGDSEARHRALVENMSNGVAVYEAVDDGNDFVFVGFNKAAEKIENIQKESIIGRKVVDVFPGVKDFGLLKVFQRVWETGKSEHHPIAMYQDNRIAGWRENFIYKLPSGEIVAVYSDETERKRAEEALRESEERYRTLFDGAVEGIIVADIETKEFKYVNRAVCNMLGYTEEELRRMDVSVIHPKEALEHIISEFEAQVRGEKALASNIPCLRKDGTTIYADINTTRMLIDGRECNVGFFADITLRKQTEEEKKKLQSQLQQAQKMEAIAALAGGVAHQFNNALTGITGNIELLRMDSPDDENVARYAERMKRSAHRMSQLTTQLLAYAKGGKYQARILSTSQFVRDTLPVIQHTVNSSVHIETDLPRNLWNIEADATQMQLVLSALLSNASEAMEEGGRVHISAKKEEISEDSVADHFGMKPGRYVCLTIEDDGRGMDEESRRRVFEPFFTTKFQGRGLGMAAAYGIVKNHNGWISVESELGKGTTVLIYLPATEKGIEKTATNREEIVDGSGTILVVDDEVMVLDIAAKILNRLGYSVLEANRGRQAVEIYQQNKEEIEIVILDMIMPDISGGEVYDRMKEINPDVKVLLSSGYSIHGEAKEILARGCDGFIQKPFGMRELSQSVREILEKE